MSLLMQALKKAERAKQEQKDSLKQLEESNLKEAEGGLTLPPQEAAPVAPDTRSEAAPPTLTVTAEPSLEFPSLEMSLSEPEPPPPKPVETPAPPVLQAPEEEPLLSIDMTALDLTPPKEEPKREEPKLELSFAEIAIPDDKPEAKPEPSAVELLVTPDESLLSFEEPKPAPPPVSPPEPPAVAKPSLPSLSLELPSIIETAPAPPPPIVLNEPPKPAEPAPEVFVAPPAPPPLPREERKEPTAEPVPATTPTAKEEIKAPETPAPKDNAASAEAAKPLQQKIAKAVFSAKQGGRNTKRLFYGILAGIVLGILSGGGYYLWQETLQPPVFVPPPQAQETQEAQEAQVNLPPGEAPPAQTPPPPDGAAPAEPDPAVAPPVPAAEQQPAAPQSPASPAKPAIAPEAAPAKTTAPKGDEIVAAAKPPVAPPTTKDTPGKAELKRTDAPPQQEVIQPVSGIKIVRGVSAATTNPLLSKAYQAFQAGDLEQAQQHYQQVLRQDSRNRDALLGMGVISIQRQQLNQAAAIYTRMLENDPNDAEAQAGLTALQGMSDPIQHESRLKNLLSKNPNAYAAHFALGNLFSKQARWAEAQNAFFRAFAGNPDNPDYAFNLAVSLDQLGQAKLALDYYQRAVALMKGNVAAFDRAAVQTRIRELTPQPGEDTK